VNYKLLFPTYRRRYQFVREALACLAAEEPLHRMLNLGCGEGDLDAMLAGHAVELDSCDINEGDVAYAQQLNTDLRNVRYRVEDAARLSYPDHAFDAVVCTDVIEHVGDPQALLAEVARVLRPSGALVLTCPSEAFPFTYDPVNALLRPVGRHLPIGAYAYGHTWLVRERELEGWLMRHGLQVVRRERLSRSLAGLMECYVPGLVQRVLKANASNRAGGRRALALTPSRGEPALVRLIDAIIAADERWFPVGDGSVGLGYVARR
jgi:2-polyprenyl-3-methyl-5-hydroxy-6-metoxy-1,4-benzoquinol methylase